MMRLMGLQREAGRRPNRDLPLARTREEARNRLGRIADRLVPELPAQARPSSEAFRVDAFPGWARVRADRQLLWISRLDEYELGTRGVSPGPDLGSVRQNWIRFRET